MAGFLLFVVVVTAVFDLAFAGGPYFAGGAVVVAWPWPWCSSSTIRPPNAFATGRNPDHAAVAVTTGLFNRLFETHPPIERRIAALREAAGGFPVAS